MVKFGELWVRIMNGLVCRCEWMQYWYYYPQHHHYLHFFSSTPPLSTPIIQTHHYYLLNLSTSSLTPKHPQSPPNTHNHPQTPTITPKYPQPLPNLSNHPQSPSNTPNHSHSLQNTQKHPQPPPPTSNAPQHPTTHSQFLEKDPLVRLGMPTSPHGKVRSHAFFNGVDWSLYEIRAVKPPFKPSTVRSFTSQSFFFLYFFYIIFNILFLNS